MNGFDRTAEQPQPLKQASGTVLRKGSKTRNVTRRKTSVNHIPPAYQQNGPVSQLSGDGLASQAPAYHAALQGTAAPLRATMLECEYIEAALSSSQHQLRRLATHLQALQEEERRRIARDIHDELAPALTSLKIDVSWLDKRLVPGQEELHVRLLAMTELIDILFDAVRRIGTAIHPHILDHLGLFAAIEWQLQDARRRTGLLYTLTLPQQEVHLEPARSTALFRIFQEALTNVLRHAAATHVEVQVTPGTDGIRLNISDNGKGIPLDQRGNHRVSGLSGMRERAQLWNGDVRIGNRHSERGTTVTVFIPYKQAMEA